MDNPYGGPKKPSNPWKQAEQKGVERDAKPAAAGADKKPGGRSPGKRPTGAGVWGAGGSGTDPKRAAEGEGPAGRKQRTARPEGAAERARDAGRHTGKEARPSDKRDLGGYGGGPTGAAVGRTDRPRRPASRQGRAKGAEKPVVRPPVSPRLLAAEMVLRMWEGRSLSDLLATELHRTAERDRSLAAELAQGVARWGHRLRTIEERLLDHPVSEKHRDIEALLLVGLYQLSYLRIPAHAAVSETVGVAGKMGKTWARGLVNGVLRNYQRKSAIQIRLADEEPASRYSFPRWLLDRVQAAWPEAWEAILEASNQRPPMCLRVNVARVDRKAYVAQLTAAGISARPLPHSPAGLLLDQPTDVRGLPGFDEGLVSVQDGGAQQAALLLAPEPGDRVLDGCAAPGGKSCHLLERQPGIALTALDKEERRLVRLRENLARLGLEAMVEVGDAGSTEGAWATHSYQRILLDVPCSGTGVIRRHPDIKWLRQPADIDALVAEQQRLLESAWQRLEAGGRLLYATCSLLPEENVQQVEGFLARHADALHRPITAEWGREQPVGRQILPGDSGMDGFYYALLEKREGEVVAPVAELEETSSRSDVA